MRCIFWDITDNFDHPIQVRDINLDVSLRSGDKIAFLKDGEYTVFDTTLVIPDKFDVFNTPHMSIRVKNTR